MADEMTGVGELRLEHIRIDGDTQSRVELTEEVVADYAEHADELPPLVVFFDGVSCWLADGFHRWHALNKAGREIARCEVRRGTKTDARMFAASRMANGTHGLRPTNVDKRRCVQMALGIMTDWSDRRIADHVGVSQTLVANIRSQLAEQQEVPR